MPGTPPGRSSSVKAQDRVFILQTEFKISPKRAIVTSVSLEGQVIHRVERAYIQEIETEEEYRHAEEAVISQHESIARKIVSNSSDFIRQTKSIRISRSDKLGIIPGVSYVSNLGEKLESENPPLIFQQSKLILEISDAITANSRVGPLKVAAIISDQGKFILDKSDSGSHLVTLKSEADIGKILMEIENQ